MALRAILLLVCLIKTAVPPSFSPEELPELILLSVSTGQDQLCHENQSASAGLARPGETSSPEPVPRRTVLS